MSNAFIIARNTIKILFRKRLNILTYIILPVVVVIALVNLMNTESGKINVGIVNNDKSGILAKDFVKSIDDQARYKIVYLKKGEVNKALTDQKVDCVVMVPEYFDKEIYEGDIKALDIKSIKGAEATAWIKSYINFYISNLAKISKASEGNREVFNSIYKAKGRLKIKETVIKNNHTSNELSEMSVGFVTMFMLMGASTISGFILKEKKLRTYFRILSAPVDSKTYVAGNFIAGMVVMLAQAALITFAFVDILRMDIKVTGLELFTLLAVFSLVSSALGSAIVAFSQNSNQAGYITTFLITPSCMISGCFWPISYMPEFMQKLSYFFPQRWLIEGVKRVQESGDFSKAFPCMAIIFGYAVVLYLLSMFKIKINRNVKSFV